MSKRQTPLQWRSLRFMFSCCSERERNFYSIKLINFLEWLFIKRPVWMLNTLRVISVAGNRNNRNNCLKNNFSYFWKDVPEFSEKFWRREEERNFYSTSQALKRSIHDILIQLICWDRLIFVYNRSEEEVLVQSQQHHKRYVFRQKMKPVYVYLLHIHDTCHQTKNSNTYPRVAYRQIK